MSDRQVYHVLLVSSPNREPVWPSGKALGW